MSWVCDSCAFDEKCKTPDVVKCSMTFCHKYQYSAVREKETKKEYEALRKALDKN